MFYLVSRSTCLILSALLLLSGVVWSISDDEDDISGSGSASGSGSGFVSGYEPDSECIPPSNDTVMLQQFSLSFEDVIAVSRCYSACLETVLQSDLSLIQLLKEPLLPWTSISQVTLSRNCDLYSQVYECQQGCEYSFKNQFINQDCEIDTMEDCTSSVPSLLPESTCPRQCSSNVTSIGCHILAEHNHTSSYELSSVMPPNGKLELRKYTSPNSNQTGTYMLYYCPSAGVSLSNSITSYLIQIQRQDQPSVYYWMMSLNDILTIDRSLICKEVNVRFMPIGIYGNRTSYSKSVSTVIGGDDNSKVPDHPYPCFVEYFVENDGRDHFWEHGVVNFTWPKPNKYQYLTAYTINITSNDITRCGVSVQFVVSKHNNAFTWRASHPGEGPINGCTYSIQILSRSSAYHSLVSADSILVSINTTNFIPHNYTYMIDMKVNHTVNPLTTHFGVITFDIQWYLPTYYKLTQGIKEFLLVGYLTMSPDGNHMYENRTYKERIKYSGLLNYSRSLQKNTADDYIVFELTTVYESNVNYIHYINKTSSHISSLKPAFSIPRNVKVSKLSINKYAQISLNISWQEPEYTYGVVTYYINIGLVPRSGHSTAKSVSTVHFIYSVSARASKLVGTDVWTVNIHDTNINKPELIPRSSKVIATGISHSDWSEPVVWNISNSLYTTSPTTTTTLVLSTATIPVLSNSTSSISPTNVLIFDAPTTDYIALFATIPVILVFLLGITCASLLLIVVCVQKKKLRYQDEKFQCSSMTTISTGFWNNNHWELNLADIEIIDLIGEGTLGPVHKAALNVKEKNKKATKHVFLINLKANATNHDYRHFQSQLENYKKIATIEETGHPFILSFIGCITMNSGTPCIVTEYPVYGNLLKYLLKKKQELEEEEFQGYTAVTCVESNGTFSHILKCDHHLTSADVLLFAQQIASAMDCLVGLGIVHKDLACRNIYIDEGRTLKVGSFGIVPNGQRQEVYPNELPLRWMALESIVEHTYSTASDVWSFGITLWEIITLGGFPYNGIKDEHILSYLMSGKRLPQPSNCSNEFFTILQSCWDSDPNCRPSFELLYETLFNQSTQGDCKTLLDIDQRPIKASLSNDSAIGFSPPVADLVESSGEHSRTELLPDTIKKVPSHTDLSYCNGSLNLPKHLRSEISRSNTNLVAKPAASAVNLIFRKDSLDAADGLKPNSVVVNVKGSKNSSTNTHVATNLDAPDSHTVLSLTCESIPDNGSTEV